MNILSLKQAEKLTKVLVPDDDMKVHTVSLERAKAKYWIRKIYECGFAVCYPENILWENTESMLEDLMEGK